MAQTPQLLTGSDSIHIATVLEDCVDQFSVLGKIMPASYDGKLDTYSVSTWTHSDTINPVIQTNFPETRLTSAISAS